MVLKLGCLISGRGSNLQALIDACAAPDFPAEIALVLSNKADAEGLERAKAAGIATSVVNHKEYADRDSFDAELDRRLRAAGVELVCLAGFMRLLTDGFVEGWRDRMINIHPSLLPALKGLKTHERALEAGARFTGCTVHYVRPEMDEGPIIAQAVVPVLDEDDAASLGARVLAEEHKLYPLAVRLIAEKRLSITGNRITVTGDKNLATPLISPQF
ncbi:phosphoribosylglycinamide formyltransferase [Lacibacterium aquatile]|uniref:Phosphoribosylglycinamide formyltransferase n=1 Tax=Lacibacterium aquatile TaxID=1168082 RepID=A0ABW5DKT6_9PROT